MSSISEQLLFGQKWTDIQPGVFHQEAPDPLFDKEVWAASGITLTGDVFGLLLFFVFVFFFNLGATLSR